MKNITFFMEPDWAFGSIHYELSKYLWAEGYNCSLLPWNRSYTYEEFQELNNHNDLWVTNQHGYRFLKGSYNIDPQKCIVITHAKIDIDELIQYNGVDEFSQFRKYGVVSNFLKEYSASVGISRIPELCPLGINYNTFYTTPNFKLTTVGYAGAFQERDGLLEYPEDSWPVQLKHLKRSYLVKECAEKAGLNFSVAQTYHNSFVTMPGFYKSVDCIITPSLNEGAGLPVLEAGAAGKLVLGTPVGHWYEKIGVKGGIELPFPENEFIEKTVEILNYYKNNPTEYHNRCLQIQEHSKTYDWSNFIESWVNLLH